MLLVPLLWTQDEEEEEEEEEVYSQSVLLELR